MGPENGHKTVLSEEGAVEVADVVVLVAAGAAATRR